jgi:hypothetical protein
MQGSTSSEKMKQRPFGRRLRFLNTQVSLFVSLTPVGSALKSRSWYSLLLLLLVYSSTTAF